MGTFTKSIVFCVKIILSIFLIYFVYSQIGRVILNSEIISENKTNTESVLYDSEIYEENQIIDHSDILLISGINKPSTPIQITCRLAQPSFSIWQPPKIG